MGPPGGKQRLKVGLLRVCSRDEESGHGSRSGESKERRGGEDVEKVWAREQVGLCRWPTGLNPTGTHVCLNYTDFLIFQCNNRIYHVHKKVVLASL